MGEIRRLIPVYVTEIDSNNKSVLKKTTVELNCKLFRKYNNINKNKNIIISAVVFTHVKVINLMVVNVKTYWASSLIETETGIYDNEYSRDDKISEMVNNVIETLGYEYLEKQENVMQSDNIRLKKENQVRSGHAAGKYTEKGKREER